ncbi:MAG: SLBB domain-containing protein [Bryobacteraceae bacterium]
MRGFTIVGAKLALGLLAGSVWLAVQNTPQKPPETPPQEPAKPKTAEPAKTTPPTVNVDPKTFSLGPEDVILVRVWREADLSGQLAVRSTRYLISGEIIRPGAYPLAAPTTVFEAITLAGGFRDFANKKNIIIIRGSQRLRFDYNDAVKGKNLSRNVSLENGDKVVVR